MPIFIAFKWSIIVAISVDDPSIFLPNGQVGPRWKVGPSHFSGPHKPRRVGGGSENHKGVGSPQTRTGDRRIATRREGGGPLTIHFPDFPTLLRPPGVRTPHTPPDQPPCDLPDPQLNPTPSTPPTDRNGSPLQ